MLHYRCADFCARIEKFVASPAGPLMVCQSLLIQVWIYHTESRVVDRLALSVLVVQ